MELANVLLSEKQDYETEYLLERGKPMPSLYHARLESRLSNALSRFEQYETLIELSVDFQPKKSTPDVCLFPKSEPDDWLSDQISVKQPPLLTIEILSPTQAMEELKDKIFDIYFPSGVKSCWIVVPMLKMIAVFTPNRGVTNYIAGIVKDPVLDIEVDMKDIFR